MSGDSSNMDRISCYDPLKAPDPRQWLELDPQERIVLVEQYHKNARVVLPNHILHATMHAAVENQLAEGIPVVHETFSRLTAEGLDRHDAIHAIATVLSEHIRHILRKDPMGDDPHERYYQALRSITAKKWFESAK